MSCSPGGSPSGRQDKKRAKVSQLGVGRTIPRSKPIHSPSSALLSTSASQPWRYTSNHQHPQSPTQPSFSQIVTSNTTHPSNSRTEQEQEDERRRMGSWYFLTEVHNQSARPMSAPVLRYRPHHPPEESAFSLADSLGTVIRSSLHRYTTPSSVDSSPRGRDLESGFSTTDAYLEHASSPTPASPAFSFHLAPNRLFRYRPATPPTRHSADQTSQLSIEEGSEADEGGQSEGTAETSTIRGRRYSEAFPSFSASPPELDPQHPPNPCSPNGISSQPARIHRSPSWEWARSFVDAPLKLRLPPKPTVAGKTEGTQAVGMAWWRKPMFGFTRQQVDVTKCAIAYFLGSLFTFNKRLNGWLPNNSSAHMIASIAVYYNPAKSVGAMVEADLFSLFVSAFSSMVSLAAVGTIKAADAAGSEAGDWAALFFWMGGACAILAWCKSWVNKPSFNSAISLGFLTMSVVIVKEGGLNKLSETLLNVLLGTAIANLTCLLIYPYSATSKLQNDINSTLTSFSTLLSLLSQTFLLDSFDIANAQTTPESLSKAVDAHEKSFTLLKKNLAEAKSEFLDHRIHRTSESYDTVVSSLTRLAQHLTGLRSGTGLQYEILKAEREGRILIALNQGAEKPFFSPPVRADGPGPIKATALSDDDYFGMSSPIEINTAEAAHRQASRVPDPPQLEEISEEDLKLAADANLLAEVREQVGPQIRSLTTACNETLLGIRATFASPGSSDTCDIGALRDHVSKALEALQTSSAGSIMSLYENGKDGSDDDDAASGRSSLQKSPKESAFLVFYFIFALDEFARELLFLLESMSEIQIQEQRAGLKTRLYGSGWRYVWRRKVLSWLRWKKPGEHRSTSQNGPPVAKRTLRKRMSMIVPIDPSEYMPRFPTTAPDTPGTATNPDRKTLSFKGQLQHFVWELAERARKPDMKYAIKVGLATALLATPAYTDTWRETFYTYKGEWALVSFYTTMAPTEGQTNFLSFQRVLGTLTGAVTAACIYTVFPENAIALPLFGFLFSLPCFWYIVTQPVHAVTARFVMVTYNLTALYSYNDRARDTPVWSVAYRRFTAVSVGVIFAFFVSRFWWPYAARRELLNGLSDFFIDLSYLYTRLIATFSEHQDQEGSGVAPDPLRTIAEEPNERTGLVVPKSPLSSSVREFMAMELHLQLSLIHMRDLMDAATKEPRFKGPFPRTLFNALLMSSQTILDRFHSIRCVVNREEWDGIVHRNFIEPVNPERREMTGNVLLFFSTISSAFKLKVPLSPYLPPAEEARVRLLMKIEDLEVMKNEKGGGARHLLFFSYVLAMAGVIKELDYIGSVLKDAYGVVGGSSANFEALFETPV